MTAVPDIELADGHRIPQIGLGVLRIGDDQTGQVVESALSVGYRHIDTAAGYQNEGGVGRGLKAAGYDAGSRRASLWLTTKLRDSEQGYDSTLRAFDRQLGLLGTDYVDMYMIHWPTPFDWRSAETWRAFQRLRQEGRVRTLGVCNFREDDLERLHVETGEYPAVNQFELHPTWQQRHLAAFCKSRKIAVEAYSPLARGADLDAGQGGDRPHITQSRSIACADRTPLAHRERDHYHPQVRAYPTTAGEPGSVRILADRV